MVDEDGLGAAHFGEGESFGEVDESVLVAVEGGFEGEEGGPDGIEAALAAVGEVVGDEFGGDVGRDGEGDVRGAELFGGDVEEGVDGNGEDGLAGELGELGVEGGEDGPDAGVPGLGEVGGVGADLPVGNLAGVLGEDGGELGLPEGGVLGEDIEEGGASEADLGGEGVGDFGEDGHDLDVALLESEELAVEVRGGEDGAGEVGGAAPDGEFEEFGIGEADEGDEGVPVAGVVVEGQEAEAGAAGGGGGGEGRQAGEGEGAGGDAEISGENGEVGIVKSGGQIGEAYGTEVGFLGDAGKEPGFLVDGLGGGVADGEADLVVEGVDVIDFDAEGEGVAGVEDVAGAVGGKDDAGELKDAEVVEPGGGADVVAEDGVFEECVGVPLVFLEEPEGEGEEAGVGEVAGEVHVQGGPAVGLPVEGGDEG